MHSLFPQDVFELNGNFWSLGWKNRKQSLLYLFNESLIHDLLGE